MESVRKIGPAAPQDSELNPLGNSVIAPQFSRVIFVVSAILAGLYLVLYY